MHVYNESKRHNHKPTPRDTLYNYFFGNHMRKYKALFFCRQSVIVSILLMCRVIVSICDVCAAISLERKIFLVWIRVRELRETEICG